jgi:hypothetical protein
MNTDLIGIIPQRRRECPWGPHSAEALSVCIRGPWKTEDMVRNIAFEDKK